ncbi:MAG: ATP-binding protein [Candidatus Omnitrophota bacterium]
MKERNKLFYQVSRRIGDAICAYDMIRDGDRIAVAVSGGKDSMAVLEMLKYRQRFSPVKYDLVAIWVDLDIPGFPKQELTDFLAASGIEFYVEKADITGGGKWEDVNCYYCAQLRRKLLFQFADREGCRKIAFGHHLDDIAETILLNMCYRAELGAMCPKQELFGGQITIIRPLAYIHEYEIRELVEQGRVVSFKGHACPNDQRSKRILFKEIVQRLERENPGVKKNILNSLKNIKKDYLL